MDLNKNFLSILLSKEYNGKNISEIFLELKLNSNEKIMLSIFISELIKNNYLVQKDNGTLFLDISKNKVIGIFRGNSKGFGFLTPLNGEEDYYIHKTKINGAIDDDIIIGRVKNEKNDGNFKKEVEVLEILVENKRKFIGIYKDYGDFGYVLLDSKKISQDVYISKRRNLKKGILVNNDDKVMVEIVKRATKDKKPEGRIVEVLGNKNDIGIDIVSIIKENDLNEEFSNEVLKELETIPNKVSKKDLIGRLDIRELLTITIDGDDSKDLDDAISLEIKNNGNYYLGVHIADVAHYVLEKTKLDEEALNRATSVYLVDRVIPMLPRKLSNNICSLNPNVDRLTLSCFMEINKEGEVIDSSVYETVINSNERMTYNDVAKLLTKKCEIEEYIILENKYKDILEMLKKMEILASILTDKREFRGSIDFDFKETKVILDENGKPIEIKPYDRNIATRIIEEFMILCNETISEKFSEIKVPLLYRVHEYPKEERIENFKNFLHGLENLEKVELDNAKDYQKLLKQLEGNDYYNAVSHILLRSMQKAEYSPKNIGHFGLASKYYSHFTSPIRRYPDLQIHRIIKMFINGSLSKKESKRFESLLPEVAKQCSKQEKIAQMAEWSSLDLKKAEYMEDKIGEKYSGIITGITEYGFYVELDNTIEGFVHVSKLKDEYFEHFESEYCLKGDKGTIFRIGDKVNILVERVMKDEGKIDFNLSGL